MARLARVALLTAVALLLSAPVALAHDGGQGLWGPTDDKVVTDAGFVVIAAFPLLIGLLSLLQWRLDKRKERRKSAEKARRGRADLRGGW
jgi:hypothetical protein